MSAEDHLELVKFLAYKVQTQQCPHLNEFDDLVSEGYLALVKAIKSFNPKKNSSLKTWISYKVWFAMIDYLRRNGITKRYRREMIAKIKGITTQKELKDRFPNTQYHIEELLHLDIDRPFEEMHHEFKNKIDPVTLMDARKLFSDMKDYLSEIEIDSVMTIPWSIHDIDRLFKEKHGLTLYSAYYYRRKALKKIRSRVEPKDQE